MSLREFPGAVVVITQNEEANIKQCLTSVVGWADQIFVVDAYSIDRTTRLALACRANVVKHEFVDWASQRNWSLNNLPFKKDWVFFLDADEVVTSEFKKALLRFLANISKNVVGFFAGDGVISDGARYWVVS